MILADFVSQVFQQSRPLRHQDQTDLQRWSCSRVPSAQVRPGAESNYFHKAFTGSSRVSTLVDTAHNARLTTKQEASASTMDIHDNDPAHFETLLKYMHTLEYDKDTIAVLANGDLIQELLVLANLCAIADKYDVSIILESIAQDVRLKLLALEKKDGKHLNKIVSSHYENTVETGGTLVSVIAAYVIESYTRFMADASCMPLVETCWSFGTDVVLATIRGTLSLDCWCARTDTRSAVAIPRLKSLTKSSVWIALRLYKFKSSGSGATTRRLSGQTGRCEASVMYVLRD